ncbi:MAG: hypothetical protein CBC25_00505 [Pelagibacteraceae bacterium TMED65]|jgi:pyruvate/2-oxoglutarate/acetoin dehydrogenase E1 component|nr:MAG: hypothetical protein CBC25_00505 [Pelagibacteraceae bacterium TMED65]|tara:strand:+ start:4063 stop:5103 length:1041 start_codon:yes stop_codon:yes gene_type:complete
MHDQAINKSIKKFLNENSNGLILCEGIDDGFFGTIDGISKEYSKQSIELPCSENASVGMTIGASMYGMLPILCFQRVEFAFLAMEQLINNTGKLIYLSNNTKKTPALIRLVIGRGWGQGPSHSESMEAMFNQIPNINLFMPVFPEDSEFIINNFSRWNNLTISLEHRWIHKQERSYKVVRSSENYIIKQGDDITIVCTSYNVIVCLKAAELLEKYGLRVEIVNLFNLKDTANESILKSFRKTKRIIFIELGRKTGGISMCILSSLVMDGEDINKENCRIMGQKTDYSPSSFRLTNEHYINVRDIVNETLDILRVSTQTKEALQNELHMIESNEVNDQPPSSIVGPF